METCAELYLDLLKRCLTNTIFLEKGFSDQKTDREIREDLLMKMFEPIKRVMRKQRLKESTKDTQMKMRLSGEDWPETAETMIGMKRMDNIQMAVTDVLKRNIEGDLIETGVWRGGATIFMRAVLKAYGDTKRKVWVADSFEGLPPPGEYEADKGDIHYKLGFLAVTLEQVQENFRRYHMLDDRVCFLKGWFENTLPNAPIEKLSVIRLDGDMYSSTMSAIEALYPKLSKGGYLIVDDYGNIEACRKAIHDYRDKMGITSEIQKIDDCGVFWLK